MAGARPLPLQFSTIALSALHSGLAALRRAEGRLFEDHHHEGMAVSGPSTEAKAGDDCPWCQSVGWTPKASDDQSAWARASMAEKFLRKVEGQLAASVYKNNSADRGQSFARNRRADAPPAGAGHAAID